MTVFAKANRGTRGHIRLLASAGAAALTFASTLASASAEEAQTAPVTTNASAGAPADDSQATSVAEVVVTGTSIRGAAPVGAHVDTVSRQEIDASGAQTVQQVLKMVPAVTGLNSAGQGAFGSADASGTDAPTIHGLGASASNSTLVLIDGNRIPLSGLNHALADPNILPTDAIERVEVLPDGASSIYGSDAVAGVVNFITRSTYNGAEVSAQGGFGDHYSTANVNAVMGKHWDDGSALIAYSYSDRSDLLAGDRSYTHANHLDQGGSNLASFNCGPASVQPAGSSNIYAYPYTGTPVSNASKNAFCDYSGLADLLPSEQRNNVMVKVRQEFGDKLTVTANVIYSDREDKAAISRGTLTATVYGPGAAVAPGQINPFFQSVAGANTETVRFDADQLLGPGAFNYSGAEDFNAIVTAEYKIDDNWRLTFVEDAGQDTSRYQQVGALCVSCAYLGLNGTTNGAGNLTIPSIPGTTTYVTNVPLTTANALDVWNPRASNLTSAAVLKELTDSTQTQVSNQTLQDAKLKLDGTLFKLPGGDVKIAVGGEMTSYGLHQDKTTPLNTGPASTGSSVLDLHYARDVKSAFAEILIPLVGPDMKVPFVEKLTFNTSGRYDSYSDFGSTANPKFAIDWTLFEGYKIRASFARSFVAPALTSYGVGNGLTAESGYGLYALGAINAPVATYPAVTGVPGCGSATTTCTLGTSVTGVQLTGGNGSLRPQTGTTWSIGADIAPPQIQNLHLNVTYWNVKMENGITSPIPGYAVNAAGLNSLLTIYPAGLNPTQVLAALKSMGAASNLPQTSALPAETYFIYDYRQRNVLNLDINGLDASADYRLKTGFGDWTFGLGVSELFTFNEQVGAGSPFFSVLNTTGFNTTFPSVQTQGRGTIGWKLGGWEAVTFINFTGAYHNWSSTTVTPVTKNAQGYPVGGGDPVSAYTTVDLHLAYNIPSTGIFSRTRGTQVFVDATNLFDAQPPFYNSAAGYDTFEASPIGRVITIGARAKF
jgi:iron complex outermembrane receptor protein